jgi:hypothetical protein
VGYHQNSSEATAAALLQLGVVPMGRSKQQVFTFFCFPYGSCSPLAKQSCFAAFGSCFASELLLRGYQKELLRFFFIFY